MRLEEMLTAPELDEYNDWRDEIGNLAGESDLDIRDAYDAYLESSDNGY